MRLGSFRRSRLLVVVIVVVEARYLCTSVYGNRRRNSGDGQIRPLRPYIVNNDGCRRTANNGRICKKGTSKAPLEIRKDLTGKSLAYFTKWHWSRFLR